MDSTRLLPVIIVAIFAAAIEPAFAQIAAPDVEQAIRPSAEYPYDWEYEGEPTLLIGGADNDNLFQWTGERLTEQASPQPTLLRSFADVPASSMKAYCLADIGNAYAVYFPEGRYAVDLDPWMYADRVRVRWLHVDGGEWSEPGIAPLDWEGSLDEWGCRGAVRLTTPRRGSGGPPGHGSAVALVEILDICDDL